MRIVSLSILLLITFFSIQGQMPKGNWQLFDADVLGYFYLSDGKQLVKVSTQGSSKATYQNSFLGEITHIDCFKGLKILVYHQNANVLVLLDNNLVQLGKNINLTDAGYFEISSACLGIDDRIWIADQQKGQLLLLNKNMQVEHEGAFYRQYTNANKIKHFTSRANKLFMVTEDNELIIFDRFGTFINKLSFTTISHPYLTTSNLYYMSENWLLQTHLETFNTDTITKINNAAKGVLKSKNDLYLLEDNKINKLKQ